MKDNRESLIKQHSSSTEDETIPEQFALLRKENEKLQLENNELKKSLEREELYHRNLYKQWNELNESVTDKNLQLKLLKSTRDPRKKVYRYTFYGLIFISLLLFAFNYNAFKKKANYISDFANSSFQNNKTTSKAMFISSQQNVKIDSTDKLLNKRVNFIERRLPETNLQALNKGQAPPQAGADLNGENLPKYVVKVKSYFHNKPDKNTRRNTFVLPWNDAYGILTPLKGENGFVYVVFTNRARRTSKGWILKSDLEPLK